MTLDEAIRRWWLAEVEYDRARRAMRTFFATGRERCEDRTDSGRTCHLDCGPMCAWCEEHGRPLFYARRRAAAARHAARQTALRKERSK